jgi:excisionase family DNA binding protein
VTDRLLTAREVADRYAVTAETVLRWTRRGDLPAIRLPGTVRGRLRYREDDLDAFDRRQSTAGPAPRGSVTHPDGQTRRDGGYASVSSMGSPTLPDDPATTEEGS